MKSITKQARARKTDRNVVSIEEIIRSYATRMRLDKGDSFCTKQELKNIYDDPMAWLSLLKGYDAFDVIYTTYNRLR